MPRTPAHASNTAMTVWIPADDSVVGRVTVLHVRDKVRLEVLGCVEYESDASVPGGVLAACAGVGMAGTGLSREEARRNLERVIEGYLEGLLRDASLDAALRNDDWRIADADSVPPSLRPDYVLAEAEAVGPECSPAPPH